MLRLLPKLALQMSKTQPVVISGPSGTGKSTLLRKLFQEYPDAFGFSVSHTTRKMRDGEVDGKQYHFTTEEQMRQEISEGKFVEHAQFSGNLYGTSKAAIKDVTEKNRICILDIDEQGVKNIKNCGMDAFYVFIQPPSLEELEKRLRKRGTETEESVKRRMDTATSAIDFSKQENAYDFILQNNDLDEAYRNLKEFFKQKYPSLLKNTPKYDASIELPLAASVRQMGKTGQEEVLVTQNGVVNEAFAEIDIGDNSVAEIPLSPSKTTSEDNPAVVSVGETPLLAMPDISNVKNSPVMVELEEPETTTSNAVCGTQSWCSLL